jgi:hypothetical protein
MPWWVVQVLLSLGAKGDINNREGKTAAVVALDQATKNLLRKD